MDEKANLLNFKDEFEVYNYSRNYIDVCREYLNDRKKYKINFKKTKYRIIYDFGSAWPGGGGYSHTLPIRVCATQRGRDFKAPDLERGIHFRGVF